MRSCDNRDITIPCLERRAEQKILGTFLLEIYQESPFIHENQKLVIKPVGPLRQFSAARKKPSIA